MYGGDWRESLRTTKKLMAKTAARAKETQEIGAKLTQKKEDVDTGMTEGAVGATTTAAAREGGQVGKTTDQRGLPMIKLQR